MKRKISVLAMLLISFTTLLFIYALNIDATGNGSMMLESEIEPILSWEQDNQSYFFLPAYMQEVPVDALQMRSCLPAMFIHTETESKQAIHLDKNHGEKGILSLYSADGNVEFSGELEEIKGRGNSTWMLSEKKPYSIQLGKPANLLGMGEAQSWILLANALDPSQLRNKIVYDFAKEIGLPYSPESHWVDLYLNGEYEGVYLLSERNEVHTERIDISRENGVLFSLELDDRLENQTCIITENDQTARIRFPSKDLLDLSKIQEEIQMRENAFLAEDGIDPLSGKNWLDLIDLDSWVRKYLVEELFGNIDAGFISQYFYLDGEKMYAGPVWDYDYSMGNETSWQLTTAHAFYANRLHVKDGYDTPWFSSLYLKPEFYDRMVAIYEQEFLPAVKALIDYKIDNYVLLIEDSAEMNRIRWNIKEDLQSEAEKIKQFLRDRICFLNSVWLKGESYIHVQANGGLGDNYAYFSVRPGANIPELPPMQDTLYQAFSGWFYAEDDAPVDFNRPIYEDVEIYAGWNDTNYNKYNRVLKLIPLGIIAFLCLFLGIMEIRRNWRGR